MPYVKRNAQGEIVSISLDKNNECIEAISPDSPELMHAIQNFSGVSPGILDSDLSFIRVIEDLVDVLIAKSVISINDLPPAVQMKLLKRKSLRSQGGFKTGDELIKL